MTTRPSRLWRFRKLNMKGRLRTGDAPGSTTG